MAEDVGECLFNAVFQSFCRRRKLHIPEFFTHLLCFFVQMPCILEHEALLTCATLLWSVFRGQPRKDFGKK